ncbi:MAG: hypothetical protein ACOZAM_10620 [Pseudomonadota bacterium]
MGNFYVNFVARKTNREEISHLLAGRDVYISPVLDDVVLIYDREADAQDWPLIGELGRQWSDCLATVILASLNHDDDILMYCLFENGVEKDSYNSAPDYFENTFTPRGPVGGDAEVLCEAFGSKNVTAIRAILRRPDVATDDDGYVFAFDRHRDLMQALGMTSLAFFAGYRHLEAGDFPEDLNRNDFIEITGKP